MSRMSILNNIDILFGKTCGKTIEDGDSIDDGFIY